MGKKTITEMQIGNTLFIVTSECSPAATETIEKKLERLIYRHFQMHNVIRRNAINSKQPCTAD